MTRARVLTWAAGAVLAVAAPVLMAMLGYSVKWGAHPFWDIKTAWIGAGLGLVIAIAIGWWRPKAAVPVGILLLGAAIACAIYGKTQFAASFAEDAFAGKMWFFGWIGIAAAVSLLAAQMRFVIRRALGMEA